MDPRHAAVRVVRQARHPFVLAVLTAALLRVFPAFLAAQAPQPAAQPGAISAQDRARCLASGQARTARDARSGALRFIGTPAGRPIPHPEPAAAAAAPETAARAYLAVCGGLIGLRDQAAELSMAASAQSDRARRIVRFRQRRDGVPIIGGEVIVHLDAAGNIMTVAGETLPAAPMNTIPAVDSATAARTALDVVANTYGVDPARLTVSTPELWIYDPAIIGPDRGPARLVWRMNVTPSVLEPIRELVLVDAERGFVPLHFNQVETVKNRVTYTLNNTTALPGALVCSEANPACAAGDADAVAAHVYAGDTYDFYLAHHRRDSLDNAGTPLISSVHYGAANYRNAFWNGVQMAYGDGFSQADDVVAHELTHGVTQHSSGLFYYYQSGAINESLADVWGELIDQSNRSANDTPALRWLIGEEIGAFRNLQNPPAFGDPDRMTSTLYYPGSGDNGGVHINSGINNKAASLMVDGGVFNGHTIAGLGIAKVAKIYYEAQTQLLTSGADYGDLFEALYQACNNLVGIAGISTADCQQVRNATLAVEMHLQPLAGFSHDAAMCAPGQTPINSFFDSLEGGTGNFTFSSATGTQRWDVAAFYAHSGTRSLYGNDAPPAASDSSAALANGVLIPANAFLHFAHSYGFQPSANQDGGVLEYSSDGGVSWNDAGPMIDANGYTGNIGAATNPLAGRAAFVGLSRGYVSSRVNLSSLAGQHVKFRWRMGLDSSSSYLGWLVDDIRVYTCWGTGLLDITPRTAPQGSTSFNVSVTGQFTSFVQGQTTAQFGGGVIVHGTSVSDATHASIHISVPSDAAPGPRDVTLTTEGEVAVALGGFRVTPGPTLTAVLPNRAQPGQQNLSVEITAAHAHFAPGQTTVTFGPGITVSETRVTGANRFTATLTVAPDAPAGGHTVAVTTGNETLRLTNGFTVRRLPTRTQAFAYAVGRFSPSAPQMVSVIDTSTNALTMMIGAGRGCYCIGANGIAAAPDGATVYVVNDLDESVTVIDSVTNTASGTIAVGPGSPAAVAVSPDSSRLYVLNGYNPAMLRVVDTSTRSIVASIPLEVMQAYGMAIAPDGSRLYVSTYSSHSVKVIDTASNAVVATVPVGLLPLGVDVSADGSLVYVSNGAFSSEPTAGSVSIIAAATNTVVATVGVGINPYTVQASRDGTRAYVANASTAGVSVIDPASRSFAGSVTGNSFANTLVFTPDSSRAYVAAGSLIQVVNVASNAVVSSIPLTFSVAGNILAMAMAPGATRVIALSGDLAFGSVPVGARAMRVLTITNTGNSPLDLASLTFPTGFSASFTVAALPAGGSRQVAVTFSPTRAGSFAGTVTVNGNQTFGRALIAISGFGSSDATRDADFDRDAATDIAIYRPSSGSWHILKSASAFTQGVSYTWGASTDMPVAGDYDGDNMTDPAVYRPSTGHWFILKSSTNYAASATYQWGTAGDIPVAGDYDGDGRSDLAIYRPASGCWYILLSTTGFTAGQGYTWGAPGDVPVPGDYDGDSRTDLGVYRPTTGHWFILRSDANYAAWSTHQWGTTGDVPVLGDYDGDNRRDLAVYRPATGSWHILRSSSGFSAGAGYVWGAVGDVPLPGDYDGDGRTDLAVYRGSSGHWFILKSSSNYTSTATYQWGTTGDVAAVRRQ